MYMYSIFIRVGVSARVLKPSHIVLQYSRYVYAKLQNKTFIIT